MSYERVVEADVEKFIASHSSLFATELRSISHLRGMLRRIRRDEIRSVGDIAGGMGHNAYHLRDDLPNAHFHVLDTSRQQIDAARGEFERLGIQKRFSADVGNVYELPTQRYDLTLLWNTLFVLDDHVSALRQLLRATKPRGHIYLSTLLNPHDVDLRTSIVDHTRPSAAAGWHISYSTYSKRRFSDLCMQLGAAHVELEPFTLDVDLEDRHEGLGTYTRTLSTGDRLQISGGMLMNWYVAHIVAP